MLNEKKLITKTEQLARNFFARQYNGKGSLKFYNH